MMNLVLFSEFEAFDASVLKGIIHSVRSSRGRNFRVSQNEK